jgi:hypothetical protein
MKTSRSITSSNAVHSLLSTLTPDWPFLAGGRHASKLLLAFEAFMSRIDGKIGQAGILCSFAIAAQTVCVADTGTRGS